MVKMKKGNIYLPLQGRIGNQLFQYALARKIQLSLPRKITIVMDDSDILRCGWVNSLENYDIPSLNIFQRVFCWERRILQNNIYLEKFIDFLRETRIILISLKQRKD